MQMPMRGKWRDVGKVEEGLTGGQLLGGDRLDVPQDNWQLTTGCPTFSQRSRSNPENTTCGDRFLSPSVNGRWQCLLAYLGQKEQRVRKETWRLCRDDQESESTHINWLQVSKWARRRSGPRCWVGSGQACSILLELKLCVWFSIEGAQVLWFL